VSAAVQDLLTSLSYARAEMLLVAFALIGAVWGAWGGARAFGAICAVGALTVFGAGLLALFDMPHAPVLLFQGAMKADGLASVAKALIAFSAAATMLLGADTFAREGDRRFEFAILTVLSVLGMFVMVSAQDLITLYVGVELQSLAAYVLAAWRRDDAQSSEAGLKYFVLGAIASGMLLFGASYVYGFTGSVRFDVIAAAVSEGGGLGIVFGLVLMICALGFKMSAAPFHMWTPDVYEGAPTPVTAFFAAAPKAAAIALLARLLYEPFAGIADQWRQVIMALSAISMLVGSFAALSQTNLKRLMAYSSVANVGFALMGLSSGRAEQGVAAAFQYLTYYLPATIGVFALIVTMKRDGAPAETIADLAGVAQKRPWMATLFTVLLFSLAGIPPLVGFFGKYVVFVEAIVGGNAWLAVVGGIAAVVAAAYYLRIIASLWFKSPAPALQRAGTMSVAIASSAALLTFPVLVIALGALSYWIAGALAQSL